MSDIAERSVIGCLLMDVKSIYYVYDSLKKEMFFDPLNKDIFGEIQKNYDIGESKNVAQIAQSVESEAFPADAIAKYMLECLSFVSASVEIKQFASVVVNDYKAYALNKLINSIIPNQANIDRQIGEIINDLDALKGQDRTTAKSMAKIVDENAPNRFTEKTEMEIFTGFDKIDGCLGGLEGGDVIVIGARPAVGKSAFATQISMVISSLLQKRVAFYNLEMKEGQIYDRMLSMKSGIALSRIRNAEVFLNDEKERFDSANESLKQMDMMISTGTKSVSEIRNEVRHLDADIIIIDYLQLIKSDTHYNNRVSEVGAISKAIKGLSTELNVPIIILSQLNRLSEQKSDKEPTMSELRESGDMEQDASIILLMWNADPNDESKKALKIEKNRQGTKIREVLRFDGAHMKFKETDEKIKPKRDGFRRIPDDVDVPFH